MSLVVRFWFRCFVIYFQLCPLKWNARLACLFMALAVAAFFIGISLFDCKHWCTSTRVHTGAIMHSPFPILGFNFALTYSDTLFTIEAFSYIQLAIRHGAYTMTFDSMHKYCATWWCQVFECATSKDVYQKMQNQLTHDCCDVAWNCLFIADRCVQTFGLLTLCIAFKALIIYRTSKISKLSDRNVWAIRLVYVCRLNYVAFQDKCQRLIDTCAHVLICTQPFISTCLIFHNDQIFVGIYHNSKTISTHRAHS